MLICYFIVAQLPHERNDIYVVFALNDFSCAFFLDITCRFAIITHQLKPRIYLNGDNALALRPEDW